MEEILNDGQGETWISKTGQLRNEKLGGAIKHVTEYMVTAKETMIAQFKCETDTEDRATLNDIMDPPNSCYNDYFKYSQPEENGETEKRAPEDKRAAAIKHRIRLENSSTAQPFPVFDIDRVGPIIASSQYRVGEHPFLIETNDGLLPRTGRPIRKTEMMRCYGYNDEEAMHLAKQKTWPMVLTRLTETIPGHSLATLLSALLAAEQVAKDSDTENEVKETKGRYEYYLGIGKESQKRRKVRRAMLAAVTARSKRPIPDNMPGETRDISAGREELGMTTINHDEQPEDEENNDEPDGDERVARHGQVLSRVINRWTTIPMPSEKDWRDATKEDPNTNYIYETLDNGNRLNYGRLENKRYYKEWTDGKLEAEAGMLYQWEEPKATRIRQLQKKVVPAKLRQTIFVAFHATPIAGHVGLYKTYWRIVAQFWWPGIYTYVRRMTTQCGHCSVANTTNHRAQQILHALSVDEPFDIIAMDIWHPGITTKMESKRANGKGKESRQGDTNIYLHDHGIHNNTTSQTHRRGDGHSDSIHPDIRSQRTTKTNLDRFRQHVQRSIVTVLRTIRSVVLRVRPPKNMIQFYVKDFTGISIKYKGSKEQMHKNSNIG
jgi:hypothetical protein